MSTTHVKTPVPFLLKHTLREYQHIGLDWLVTMYEKGLNGILADEMVPPSPPRPAHNFGPRPPPRLGGAIICAGR